MKLLRFAQGFLVYNIGVILFGAFVRATGSGAGCGAHWPLCNGDVIPREAQIQTLIEYTHRLTSGICLIGVIALAVAVFRARPKGDPARAWSIAALLFTISEALVGAALVLLEHVAHNPSMKRGFSVSIHLVNTFLLVLSLVAVVRALRGLPNAKFFGRERPWTAAERAWLVTAASLVFVGMTGAIAALGDTLWPAQSLAHGWQEEFSHDAPLLLRLRALHPFVAVLVGLGVVRLGLSSGLASGRRVAAMIGVGIAVGVVNWLLLAPVWMQMVHLLVGELVWISFVWAWFDATAEGSVSSR